MEKKFGHEQRKLLPCPKSSGYNFVAKQKTNPPMSKIIAIQDFLRPELPTVVGCKDYHEEKRLLERVDRMLEKSGVERLFLELSLGQFEANAAKMEAAGEKVRGGQAAIDPYMKHSSWALRCTVLKNLVGESYRKMSADLAKTPLYQCFCRFGVLDLVRVPGKSTLQDYTHWLPTEQMERIKRTLTQVLSDSERAREIGLESELDMTAAWVDSTCVKSQIHFPTDWVLMRDAVRTLVKSILVIRRHGLVRRISEPEGFLREINALGMGMSASGRGKPGSKKERKRMLRAMKRLSKTVEEHGNRYRCALDANWKETDLTRKECEVILRRMDNVLRQLPEARRQAHERIIGGRQVPNDEKILSLDEEDARVIVRGKAGAAVEFGNPLFLAENVDGYIMDHELKREKSRGDAKWLRARYEGMKEISGGRLCGVIGDRGYESKATVEMLEADEAFNGLCPRNPPELAHRLESDEVFAVALKRRGQTEGRIGIFKNVFLGGTPLAKGFKNRELQVAWAVLAHNLWVAARLPWVEKADQEKLAA